jgi:hypothetical protein
MQQERTNETLIKHDAVESTAKQIARYADDRADGIGSSAWNQLEPVTETTM